MKIAIVGAGLAGLSVCWHLCQFPNAEITLFDAQGIGGGASGISTGLLHPFAGRRALLSWEAETGMQATNHLLDISSSALGREVCERTGIFRPAISDQQRRDFSLRAEWKESSAYGPGLWIPGGITVYSRLYLEGLWKACVGAKFIQHSISNLAELDSFDKIVLTLGSASLQFAPHLPLQITKGQTLLCRWKNPLPFSLASKGHISPTEDAAICQIGSTYEHDFQNMLPSEKALELIDLAAKFYPPAKEFEIIEIRAGARISRPKGYRPIIDKLNDKTWIFTGLGSRGLLYHGFLGKKVADCLIS